MDLGNLVEYGFSAPPPDWRDDLSWHWDEFPMASALVYVIHNR